MKTPIQSDYYRIQEIMFEIEKCIEVRSFEFLPNGTWEYDKVHTEINEKLLSYGWQMERRYQDEGLGSEKELWILVPNV